MGLLLPTKGSDSSRHVTNPPLSEQPAHNGIQHPTPKTYGATDESSTPVVSITSTRAVRVATTLSPIQFEHIRVYTPTGVHDGVLQRESIVLQPLPISLPTAPQRDDNRRPGGLQVIQECPQTVVSTTQSQTLKESTVRMQRIDQWKYMMVELEQRAKQHEEEIKISMNLFCTHLSQIQPSPKYEPLIDALHRLRSPIPNPYTIYTNQGLFRLITIGVLSLRYQKVWKRIPNSARPPFFLDAPNGLTQAQCTYFGLHLSRCQRSIQNDFLLNNLYAVFQKGIWKRYKGAMRKLQRLKKTKDVDYTCFEDFRDAWTNFAYSRLRGSLLRILAVLAGVAVRELEEEGLVCKTESLHHVCQLHPLLQPGFVIYNPQYPGLKVPRIVVFDDKDDLTSDPMEQLTVMYNLARHLFSLAPEEEHHELTVLLQHPASFHNTHVRIFHVHFHSSWIKSLRSTTPRHRPSPPFNGSCIVNGRCVITHSNWMSLGIHKVGRCGERDEKYLGVKCGSEEFEICSQKRGGDEGEGEEECVMAVVGVLAVLLEPFQEWLRRRWGGGGGGEEGGWVGAGAGNALVRWSDWEEHLRALERDRMEMETEKAIEVGEETMETAEARNDEQNKKEEYNDDGKDEQNDEEQESAYDANDGA
ncbi:uncharacterized protein BDR25DRAFT_338814 [Lindgomyces ingoldianus]|uniref:Uncharacterized protein n=1 Tax=Lindgomyces ingoldianus TaxID=673940 RepID=A0ACB6RGC9_9PLEO|nr:uncharacterized protein BDR25DRAFT_338814 [Lindgomyces ingoldianus]KAF2478172.1 hypothetical protein BDR25DRAFT_338814 [Lindgomyces ingoldianus]